MAYIQKILQRPFFYDAAIEGNAVYFPMISYNALCKGNLENDQVEIAEIFPDVPSYIYCSYMGIYQHKKYLLFAPHNSNVCKDFLLYDMKHSNFKRLSNSRKVEFYSNSAYERGDSIYIVSRETGEVNRINLHDFSVKNIFCRECVLDSAQIIELERIGDSIYIPCNQKQIMLIFDMDKEEFKCFEYPVNISFISTISFYDEKFWITGKNRKIYTWKLNDRKANEAADFPDNLKMFCKEDLWFSNSLIYENVLWLFPGHTDLILKYNMQTGCFEELEIEGEEEFADQLEEELKTVRCFASKYSTVQKRDNRVFFLSSKTRFFYEIDLQTNNMVKHDFRVCNRYNGQIYPPAQDGILSEKNYIGGVECLLKNLGNSVGERKGSPEKKIGKTINDVINL